MDLKELKTRVDDLSKLVEAVNLNVKVLTGLSQRRVTIFELDEALTKLIQFGCADLTQEETIYFRNVVNKLQIWCSYLDEGKPKMHKKLKYTEGGCNFVVVDGTSLLPGYDEMIDKQVKLLNSEDGKQSS
jgi:hypothetical protein